MDKQTYQIIEDSGSGYTGKVSLVVDTYEDVKKLPTEDFLPGSDCVCLEGSRVFMLSNARTWEEI